LVAPCWIGDQVFVEPGAIVGPGVILEDRSVVEKNARVALSWVGPNTFVGPMTSIASSLAWGSSLTNWRSDSSLRVPDSFLLCSLAPIPSTAAVRPSGAPNHAVGSPLKWIAEWPEPIRPAQNPHPSAQSMGQPT
jgi:carbonic anhydrase/acetyltransferase-like protein (isoleucine patch superfamily)